jgi:hypothetical protein
VEPWSEDAAAQQVTHAMPVLLIVLTEHLESVEAGQLAVIGRALADVASGLRTACRTLAEAATSDTGDPPPCHPRAPAAPNAKACLDRAGRLCAELEAVLRTIVGGGP